MDIYSAYVPKYDSVGQKHVVLLMIPNREGWHYKKITERISAYLREITSKLFYCLNCIHSFRAEIKLELHIKVCENKDFCNIFMPFEDTKILEFSQYQKYDNAPFIIYADLKKIDGCKNNPEKSSTTKVGEHILSGFSLSKISSLKSIENKHDE